MENLKSEKNWDVLGKKVAEYIPDEYTNGDWEAMSKMLDPGKPTFLQILKSYALLIISAFTLSTIFLVLTYSNWGEQIGIKAENGTSPIEQKIMQAEKGIIKISEIEDLKPKNSNESNLDKPESIVTTVKNTKKPDLSDKLNTKDASVLSNTITGYSESSMKVNNRSKIGASNVKSVANKNTKPLSQQSNETISKYEINSTTTTFQDNINAVKNQSSNISFQKEISERQINKNLTTSVKNEIVVLNKIPLLDLSPVGLSIDDSPILMREMIDTDIIDKRIKFGLQIGLNNTITNYSPSELDFEMPRTSHLAFFGVFAKKQLSRRWNIELGLQYKTVNNYNLLLTTRREWFNHNGLAGFETKTNIVEGYQAWDIPITLNFRLSDKLFLNPGLRYSYIKTNIEVSNSFSSSIAEGGRPGSPLIEIVDGFWKHDFGIVLGAEYRILNKWSLSLRLNQGIRDITPDNLFPNDKRTHLNSDIQLSLKYILSKK